MVEEIRGQQKITEHVVEYCKGLFGHNRECWLNLGSDFWPSDSKVPDNDISTLTMEFQLEEIKKVVMEVKVNSAPGPSGFGTFFFQKFWELIKGDLAAMFKDFWEGNLDIKCLNFSVITLVPKLKEANNIKQFHGICLLNVDFKCFTKVLTNRLVIKKGD